MFWDKKEEKRLPDLPPLNIGPNRAMFNKVENEEGEMPNEKHNLPSFPDSPMNKGFSQAAIKDAVSTEEIKEEAMQEFPNPEQKFKTIEMEEWNPSPSFKLPNPPEARKTSDALLASMRTPPEQIAQYQRTQPKNLDIFVKIEKFYSVKKALDATKNSLTEIDELLNRIRETKLREEQELSVWEKEMNAIKARIQDVTENIFEKVE